MTDLMTHVESIVRPVRATQSRKLRMRRELFAHLESAHAEELALNPDEALTRAQRRLGDPAAVAAQLQQTVPLLERLLLSRLPTPRAYDRWESRPADRLWGAARPATLPHAGLLIAASACLPYAACLAMVFRAGHPSTYAATVVNHPTATLLIDALLLVTTLLLFFFLSTRFIAATASPHPRRTLVPATSIAALLTLTLLACVLGLARRPLNPTDLATAAVTIPTLLLSLSLTGHLLATLQRPYNPWLTLGDAALTPAP